MSRGAARRVVGACALGAVLSLAAGARLADLGRVLVGGEVIPVDGDSAYHLRRIVQTAERFPRVETMDPDINWPRGAACPWADGFDLLGAVLARAVGGGTSRARAELAAALLPVLLGLLVVWATMDLARLVARRGRPGWRGGGVALAAGLVVALVPQAVASSRFGRVDHHVAEALAMVLLAGWALRGPPATRRGALAYEAGGAAAAAFACWTFSGGPLYVGLAAAIAVAWILRAARPAWLGSGAPGLLAGASAAALLTVPAVRAHGRVLSFQHASLLQPLLVGAAAVALAAAVLVARRRPAQHRARRWAAWAVVTALTAGAALLATGAATEIAAGVRGWLLTRDPWLAAVGEFQPLLAGGGLVAPLLFFFGAPGVAAPVLLLAGGAWAVRRSGARGAAFVALSAGLLALTLVQSRFGRVFAPFLAVNTALALEGVAWNVARIARRQRLAGLAAALGAATLALADPRLRGMLAIPPPRPLAADAAAALDIRRPSGASASEAAPGVLTSWASGHLVSLLADRPVVVNGFGTYLDAATFWEVQGLAALDAAGLDAWLARRRVGWVVMGAGMLGAITPPDRRVPLAASSRGLVLDPPAMRELPLSTFLIAGSGIPEAGVPHLAGLFPRFASEQLAEGFAFPLPSLWAFERVPGARLRGRATPGARVVVAIPFDERGRPHLYRAWGDAGPDGRFEVVVPLPTGYARPSLRTAPRAAVELGGAASIAVAIPEASVRSGGVVEVPPAGPRPPR